MKFIQLLYTRISLRILWFNWRDIKSPDAGGAELFTHEVMSRLVLKGHEMTLFTARFTGSLRNEVLDGVKIIRDGGKYKVYGRAKAYYKRYWQNYDIVVDEINTRPFLTPKFANEKPTLALFHQLAREFWFYETRFPLNYIGYYYLEKKWLSYYKDINTVTVSNSSKADLEAIGFKKIFLVPEGLNITPLTHVPEKESTPTVLFIGRLKKAKLPDHALKAFSIIKKEMPTARMWVIGDGYMRQTLEEYKIKDVTFFGHLENDLKFEMLSKAHLILVPAIREGWGLVVTESNAMGTPVVAYDVPGLRDSVRDGETGILVKECSPESLADTSIKLLKNRNLLNKYSSNALIFSRQFSWDNTADEFDKIIKWLFQK